MKVLLDSCVWGRAKAEIAAQGHDVVWAGDWPQDPGDDEILARAFAEERVLVTLDKDFGELAVVKRAPHAGIVRLVGVRATEQARYLLAVLTRYAGDLSAGGIVTVEPGRVRVRAGEEQG